MKNKILFLILMIMVGIMYVKAYGTEDFVRVVNGGKVTSEFLEAKKEEGCNASLSASGSGTVTISYSFVCKEEKEEIVDNQKKKVEKETYNLNGNVTYVMNSENILITSLDRTEKEEKADPFYEEVVALTPFWGVEMSSKYGEVSKYVKKNHKSKLNETLKTIFDKCYFEKMGVCYSRTPGMNTSNYLGKILMDDSGANYALKALKQEQREINTKNMSIRLGIVAIILVVVILVLKASTPDPRRKRCKY